MDNKVFIERSTFYNLGKNENGFYTLKVRELNPENPTITVIFQRTCFEGKEQDFYKENSGCKYYSLEEIKELSKFIETIENIVSNLRMR